jgi:hypothetical protein
MVEEHIMRKLISKLMGRRPALTALPLIDAIRHEALRVYFTGSSLDEVMAVSQSWDFFPLDA